MQVRNWGAANRLATSASNIQSKIDMVYSSVRDSVNTQGTPSPHIKMIGQDLQAGEKKERARGRMLARGSQDGSRLVRAVQVMILVVALIRGKIVGITLHYPKVYVKQTLCAKLKCFPH